MEYQLRNFFEHYKESNKLTQSGLPLKKRKKKKAKYNQSTRHIKEYEKFKLNKSLGPLSSSRPTSQKRINKEFTNLLLNKNKKKYKNLKKSKFDGTKFENWRSQNLIKQENLQNMISKKRKEQEQ